MKKKIIVVYSSHLSDEEDRKFNQHIESTIGVKDYEILRYVNHGQYSLPQIYNQALKNYDDGNSIFVFCHNDIIFKTKGWGKILLARFNNNNDFDIIGVAGSTYLPASGRWWEDPTKMIGIVEHTNGLRTWVSQYSEKFYGIRETVLIDGLFMAVNPTTIEHYFDEDFNGFHFYDLSFCLPNYLDGCNIGVLTDIRILHKSIGMTNQQWEENRQKFIRKYYKELPIATLPKFNDIEINLPEEPKVSVIIPTKNNLDVIRDNILAWNDIVTYNNYEIIIADTGSDPNIIKSYNEFLNDKIKVVKYNYYNFAKINNDVVINHISDDTELLLFCNDDIELLNDALTRCVDLYLKNKDTVGTIGIRLHYSDSSVQHCGVGIYRDKIENIHLTHIDIKKEKDYSTNVKYNSLGNTAAFLLINRELFMNIGYFNEDYIECFEDVELNLKCLIKGKNNITACDAVAFHYESMSRDKQSNKLEKLQEDYKKRLHPFYLKNKNILDKYIRKIQ